jgi:hypothetical protein
MCQISIGAIVVLDLIETAMSYDDCKKNLSLQGSGETSKNHTDESYTQLYGIKARQI